MKKILSLGSLMLGLMAFAGPSLANRLAGATASADCTGYSLTVDAISLGTSKSYTVNYTFTLTPTAGPPVLVTGSIPFTASGATATVTASGTWPGSPLSASYTVTGSAVLTSSGSTVPITVNGSKAASLNCGRSGRMTGGGSVFEDDGTRVTHGFELHCDAAEQPNRLEVNWASSQRFHLETLTSAFCYQDPSINAGQPTNVFNTYVGAGTGRLDGVPGATAAFTFTDAGEPGKNDVATIVIKDSGGNVVLTVSGTLESGNQQAHVDNALRRRDD
jgi:hypothetical protein